MGPFLIHGENLAGPIFYRSSVDNHSYRESMIAMVVPRSLFYHTSLCPSFGSYILSSPFLNVLWSLGGVFVYLVVSLLTKLD